MGRSPITHRPPPPPPPTPPPHTLSPDTHPHSHQVLHRLGTHPTSGLTDAQASAARALHGPNELPPDPSDPLWRRLARQFDDLLVKILVAAAVVDLAISFVNGETGAAAFVEPGVIVAILVANAAVGVATEANAERALAELRAYEADAAVVVRGGRVVTLPAAALVPGDLIHLAVGARVPADARLVRADGGRGEIRVDQSLLTGESDSVAKMSAPLPPSPDRGGGGAPPPALVAQDKANIVFAGTLVTAGRASAVVVATGGATAMGAVRAAVAASSDDDAPTPLKQKLDEFGVVLSRIIAGVCITVWIVSVPRFRDPAHGGWVGGAVYYFKIAVALAVAAIPEGLPAVVTTCLALGTRKMAARNAIVRSLPAVETLGCTTVIASDKTGTLTTNQMTVVTLALADGRGGVVSHGVTGAGFAPGGAVLQASSGATATSPLPTPASHPALAFAAACSALCNDAELEAGPGGSVTRVGEATEAALRAAAEKIGVPPPGGPLAPPPPPPPLPSGGRRLTPVNDAWRAAAPRCAALEFCRSRKMMSVLTRPAGGGGATTAEGGGTLWVKGAPEAVLARCTHAVAAGPSGARTPLDASGRDALLAAAAAGARSSALRWLALATRELPAGAAAPTTDDEKGLTLLALVGLRDPPRPEVRDAVTACRAAGVRVLMVTGDGADTAAAVARDVGILGPGPPPDRRARPRRRLCGPLPRRRRGRRLPPVRAGSGGARPQSHVSPRPALRRRCRRGHRRRRQRRPRPARRRRGRRHGGRHRRRPRSSRRGAG